MRVLIHKQAVTEYKTLDLATCIEGRHGSNFEIEVRNKTAGRVEIVASVDGVSITDGKLASAASTGYVLNGYQTIIIPGWKLDGRSAASFRFTNKKGTSYAEQVIGEALAQKGVIGLIAYSEKIKPVTNYIPINVWPNNTPDPWYPGYPGTPIRPHNPTRPYWDQPIARGMTGATLSASSSTMSYNAGDTTKGISSASACLNSATLTASAATAQAAVSPTEEVVQMGTEFGSKTDFKTTTTSFERGAEIARMEMYYSDASGLRKDYGVDVTRPQSERPKAFPADSGCPTPPGWNG